MAAVSGIAWTKSTFNSWIGCTKVGPGCDNCYAESLDTARLSKTLGGGTKEIPIKHWGVGAPRYRTSVQNWKEPLKWNKKAPDSEFAGRKGFWPVFCASLADVFDNEVDPVWRQDLFELIAQTPNLTWMLLTKRIGMVMSMLPQRWLDCGIPENIWMGATIVNQLEADRDLPKLLSIPASKLWVSYEPALGPVDWRPYLRYTLHGVPRGIDWLIVGGDARQVGCGDPRQFELSWARTSVKQVRAADSAVFVKQLGSNPFDVTTNLGLAPGVASAQYNLRWQLKEKSGADPTEWPTDLCVREFPL